MNNQETKLAKLKEAAKVAQQPAATAVTAEKTAWDAYERAREVESSAREALLLATAKIAERTALKALYDFNRDVSSAPMWNGARVLHSAFRDCA